MLPHYWGRARDVHMYFFALVTQYAATCWFILATKPDERASALLGSREDDAYPRSQRASRY